MGDQLDLNGALTQEVLQRMMRDTPAAVRRDESSRDVSPTLLAALGSLADGASTYALLRKGYAEDNPLFRPLGGHPAATGLGVVGANLAGVGLAKLLGKKWPRAGRALMANHAGATMGLAGKNIEHLGDGFSESSADSYRKAVMAALSRAR